MNNDSETRKWILRQGEYRRLYSSLFQQHRGALQISSSSSSAATATDGAINKDDDPFAEESMILTNIYWTETLNIALGMGAVAATLGSLRFVRSKHAISTVFGRSKAAAMKEAETEGKRRGTDNFQKKFANVVEGLFSLWVGYRCYDFVSHNQSSSSSHDKANHHHPTDSVDAIVALPLCRGRSKISEALCPGWINITKQQIPRAYWRALEEGRLRDERTWNAIQTFSGNCERRLATEVALRKKLSLSDHQSVSLPARVDASNVLSSSLE